MVINKSLQPTAMMKKAHQAIREAVRKTLLEHKAKGLPIFVWKNAHVVRISARQISLR
jgi:hypothetical protein